jgi:hypothetical protein
MIVSNFKVTRTNNVRTALIFKSKTLTHSSNAMITYDKMSNNTNCRTIMPMKKKPSGYDWFKTRSHIVAKYASKPMVIWAFVISLIDVVSTYFFIKIVHDGLIYLRNELFKTDLYCYSNCIHHGSQWHPLRVL